ncbi:MAG TPA: 6,7-dimethyl-8-ribityllumazine synthase [Candidatus Acidoferrum sp.]|nr:6,7-dimethyl-8-ribityllumazine synthase [Candidatus Acidoferrum sp.]
MSDKLNPKPVTGKLKADGLRFGIVVSSFNAFITDRLLRSALDALASAGATDKQIGIVRVPGSFEIPLAAKKVAESGRVQAVIAIGCVLRGDTSHYDYICSEVARGVQLAQMDTGVPVIFCVLTCDTVEQAIDRAGLKGGNKGHEAGLAAIEMATLSRKLSGAARISARVTLRRKRG